MLQQFKKKILVVHKSPICNILFPDSLKNNLQFENFYNSIMYKKEIIKFKDIVAFDNSSQNLN